MARPPIDHITDSHFLMEITGGRAAFSPDSAALAYSSFSESVTIWDVKRGVFGAQIDGFRLPSFGRFLFPRWKICGCSGGRGLRVPILARHPPHMHANVILMWEVETGKLRCRLEGHEDRVLTFAFSPDGRLILSGGADGTMRIWEVFSGRQLCSCKVGGGPVNCVAVSPDGQWIATASSDGRISLFTTSTVPPSEAPPAVDQEAFERLWHDLASEQASVAYDAVQRLSVRSDLVLEQFRKRISGVESVDLTTITARIADLDADDFDRREAASKQLAAFGPQAESALRKALEETTSAEVRSRIGKLLKPLDELGRHRPRRPPLSPCASGYWSGSARPRRGPSSKTSPRVRRKSARRRRPRPPSTSSTNRPPPSRDPGGDPPSPQPRRPSRCPTAIC